MATPPSALQGRAFTRTEATRRGVTSRDLNRPPYLRWAPNLYTIAGRAPHPAELLGVALRKHAKTAVSGAAAAALYGLPLPARLAGFEPWSRDTAPTDRELADALPATIQTVLHSKSGNPDSETWAWERTSRSFKVNHVPIPGLPRERVPVVHPVSLFPILGRKLSTLELVIVADALVRTPYHQYEPRRVPYSGLTELTREVALHKGTRGIAKVRAALPLARQGSDSPKETEVRILFHLAQLPECTINTPIHLENGRVLRAPDGAWPAHRVAWEYQGASHMSLTQMRTDDAIRQSFHAANWQTVYLFRDDLPHPTALGSLLEQHASTKARATRAEIAATARSYPAVRKVLRALNAHGRRDA